MESKDLGYILVHRSLKNHWLWQNSEYLKRWIFLLMEASFQDTEQICRKTNEVIQIRRGTVWTSTRNLAEKWECSNSTVDRFLKLLEREKMIALQGTQYGTFINVLNYCTYQDIKGVSSNAKRDKDSNTDETQTKRSRVQSKELKELKELKEDKYMPAPPADGGEWQ